MEDVSERLERIKDYAQQFGYISRNLEERLDDNETERLQNIRSTLSDVRKDIEDLIADYRARTGEG